MHSIYNVIKYVISNKSCSIEISIIQKIMKNLFSEYNFWAYKNDFWMIMWRLAADDDCWKFSFASQE